MNDTEVFRLIRKYENVLAERETLIQNAEMFSNTEFSEAFYWFEEKLSELQLAIAEAYCLATSNVNGINKAPFITVDEVKKMTGYGNANI